MPEKSRKQAKALKVIRKGGKPAVVKFIDGAHQRYESGGEEELRRWIAVALDDLPQQDKAEMIAMLLGAAFDAERE